MYKKLVLCSIILSFLPLIAIAEKYKSMEVLTGKFNIKGKTVIYAPADEPKDTHFSIYLTGNAAKTLYEAMKVKPAKERCEPQEGVISKYIKEMKCTFTIKENKHECYFAINVKKQIIEGGWMC